jgi:hypothetical protein
MIETFEVRVFYLNTLGALISRHMVDETRCWTAVGASAR